jgi:hypothetical protein
MFVATVILSVLLALAFAGAGVPKILAQPKMVEAAAHLGLPVRSFRIIGLVEVAAAAGLLIGLAWAPLGIAAAAGLVLLMIGAIVFHVRAKDPVEAMAPVVVLAVLSVVTLVLRITSA